MFSFQDLFQWERFITPSIIKIFYWLAVGISILGGIYGLIASLFMIPFNAIGGLFGPTFDPAAPKVVINLVSVSQTAPGQIPQIVFNVTVDGTARDIVAQPLTSLRLTVAGPTPDASFPGNPTDGAVPAQPVHR
jgi:hypothetical protein